MVDKFKKDWVKPLLVKEICGDFPSNKKMQNGLISLDLGKYLNNLLIL
jgi:hypothetical protein